MAKTSPPTSSDRPSPTEAPERTDSDRGRSRGGSLWSLLAWAGVGFAAARALHKAPPADRPSTRSATDRPASTARPPASRPPVDTPAQPPPPVADEAPRSVLDLPDELTIDWIPGPFGGLRVARSQQRAALPVIYVHGLGSTLDQWAPCFASAAEKIRPVAFDLPGHGGSDPAEAPTADALAATIGAVVDSLGARRVALVGHSLGASIALRWAARHPDRVAGLLLVDPSGDQSRLPASARESVLSAVADDAHDELAGHYRQFLGASSPEVADAVLERLAATPAEVLYELLAVSFAQQPVDDLVTYRQAGGAVRAVLSAYNDAPISLHRLVPELEVAWVEGAGHWLMLDAPEIFLELQGRFFAETLGKR